MGSANGIGTPVADIELVAVRPSTNAGNVRAFVSIRLGGVTIHGAKIVRQAGQAAWLAMPDRPYDDAAGKKRCSAVVELSPDLKRKVSDFVTAEWERRCAPAAPAPAA